MKLQVYLYRISLATSIIVFNSIGAYSTSFFQNTDTVTIHLGWLPQFQFAGYYAALDKGFYEEVGLNVKLKTHDVSENSVEAVLSGVVEYGVATGSMLLGNTNVKELTVLAAYQQQSPVALITLEDSPIERLKDFQAKNIVGGTEIKAMFKGAGVTVDSIGLPVDITEITRLEDGKYDAMSIYIIDLPILRDLSDSSFKIFKPSDYGINFYGECLFTTRKELLNNQERVEKIISATKKGWEYALKNKSEIAGVLLSKYGSSHTKEQLMEEATIMEESLIIPSLYEIGSMQKTKWREMSKALNVLGIIKEDINFDDFIYEKKEFAGNPLLKRILIAVSLIASLVTVGAVALFIFNQRLKRAVIYRTNDLNEALDKLNIALINEKEISDHLETKVIDRTEVIEEQKVKLELINSQLENRVSERTEILQKANQELDRFIYSMTHDIRAPLASVQGLISVIELDPEKKDEYIKLIGDNVKQLDSFVEEILEYTRNTKKDMELEQIDLDSLVDTAFEGMKYIKGAERIKLIKDINFNSPLVTDKTRLFVVLRNLISNAIKYQDKNKDNPFVKVIVKSDNNKIIVTIEDNGVGIPKEHLIKIYDMFYRATDISKGSGLGLYIVKEIVSTMKGTSSVDSELGNGAIFKFEFPNHSL